MTQAIPNKTFWNFWSKVRKTPYCWEWTHPKMWDKGHPRATDPITGRTAQAARIAFVLTKGRPPKNWAVKVCQTKWCVNPDHLVEGHHSTLGKIRTRLRKKLTPRRFCLKGHEFTKINTLIKAGDRLCRVCSRSGRKRWWDKHASEINARRRARYAQSKAKPVGGK